MDSEINHLSTGAGFLPSWDFKTLVEPSQMVRHDVLTGFLLGLEPRRMVTCESVVFYDFDEVSMGEGLCLKYDSLRLPTVSPWNQLGFFMFFP